MTSIEVPDWVAQAYIAAYHHAYDTEELPYMDSVKSALAAALEAWVVPVGRKQPHKEYLMHTRAHDDYAAGLFGDAGVKIAEKFTEQVYVLRQEKPE